MWLGLAVPGTELLESLDEELGHACELLGMFYSLRLLVSAETTSVAPYIVKHDIRSISLRANIRIDTITRQKIRFLESSTIQSTQLQVPCT